MIDSGYTNYMTSNENIFKKIDQNCDIKVMIGNDEFLEAKGKGEVVISSPLGTKIIYDVLFVPAIDQNLFSISQLLEKNCIIVFKDYGCIISDSLGQEIVTILMKNKSFMLDWNLANLKAYTSFADDVNLWHKILGHANYESFSRMYEAGLVIYWKASEL